MTETLAEGPRQTPEEQLTFCLIHGSFHDGWCWHLMKQQLEERGHDVIVPTLPIDDVRASFNSEAEVIADAIIETNPTEVVMVAHSSAANKAPRVPKILAKKAGDIAVKKIIHIAGTVQGQTINRPRPGEDELPARNSIGYESSFYPHPEIPGLVVIDHELARFLFYRHLDPDLADEALAHLRPQRRGAEPKMKLPQVSANYILCNREVWSDGVVTVEMQNRFANWLQADEIVELEAGHMAMLEKPSETAELLIRMALGTPE